ncbi:MAG TPA: lytic transglycosylase domain-containing protein [Myxococcales bacterium]|nr:lytic transglycosylase domain-containing protein [Myxococcales bacterium]
MGNTTLVVKAGAARRKTLALVLAMAVGAGVCGAVLGLVRHPEPNRTGEQFAYTATAAVAAARDAEARARDAVAHAKAMEAQAKAMEQQLAETQARLAALAGVEQDQADLKEAERIGIPRFMKDSTALWGDERRRVEIAIVREARINGLDPLMVAAVIHVESHFNPFATSGVGAKGLMQLMPPTAQWLMDKDVNDDSTGKIRAEHLFNPVFNIKLGTAYLAQLLNRFDGDINLALIAYNAGPGTAHSLTPNGKAFKRLSVYPQSVLAAYRTLLTPPQQLASR